MLPPEGMPPPLEAVLPAEPWDPWELEELDEELDELELDEELEDELDEELELLELLELLEDGELGVGGDAVGVEGVVGLEALGQPLSSAQTEASPIRRSVRLPDSGQRIGLHHLLCGHRNVLLEAGPEYHIAHLAHQPVAAVATLMLVQTV